VVFATQVGFLEDFFDAFFLKILFEKLGIVSTGGTKAPISGINVVFLALEN
jgi:hypothetical protein